MKDPLEGKTLEFILKSLIATYEFQGLSSRLKLNCFSNRPSLKSSLKFLRRTPWARKKVENLYLQSIKDENS